MGKSSLLTIGIAVFSCCLAAPASAQTNPATTTPPPNSTKSGEPPADPRMNVDVHGSTTWTATDQVDRPAEGRATLHLRLSMPGEYGTWAYLPSRFASDSARVIGGDIALTSQLSLVLEGAEDPFDHRFSGAATGLRWNFMPFASPLQLSIAAGMIQDLAGARGEWSQFAMSEQLGRLRLATALRASSLSGPVGREQLLSGSAGVSYDLLPVRLGVEYAFDRGLENRSAVLPWVEMPTKGGHVAFRAGPVLQLNGANAFPARASVAGNF